MMQVMQANRIKSKHTSDSAQTDGMKTFRLAFEVGKMHKIAMSFQEKAVWDRFKQT